MTATLEEPRVDPVAAYEMPRPVLGQGVTWYSMGTRSGAGEMAFVIHVGKRNIVLSRASGLAVESVRHIDDPKLQMNSEQRANGAWDFTDRDKQIDRLLADATALAERVKTLEELLDSPKKGK